MAILARSRGAFEKRQRRSRDAPIGLKVYRLVDPFARQNVCNRTKSPTPTAGPANVASTSIMKDFATITLPRTDTPWTDRPASHRKPPLLPPLPLKTP
jgi:hypothetical protein